MSKESAEHKILKKVVKRFLRDLGLKVYEEFVVYNGRVDVIGFDDNRIIVVECEKVRPVKDEFKKVLSKIRRYKIGIESVNNYRVDFYFAVSLDKDKDLPIPDSMLEHLKGIIYVDIIAKKVAFIKRIEVKKEVLVTI